MKTTKRNMFKRRGAGEVRVLNVKPSRDHGDDWEMPEVEPGLNLPTSDQVQQLPNEYDTREQVPSPLNRVYNQGQSGACVGFATAVCLEQALWKAKKLRRVQERYRPSPWYLHMQSKELDRYKVRATTMLIMSGTYIKDCIHPLLEHGSATNRMFDKDDILVSTPEEQWAIQCRRMKIKSYHRVSPWGRGNNYEGYKWWLFKHGPILTRLVVDQQFMRGNHVMERYKGDTNYGHAVCVVAYKPGYFLVRNSWGDRWGDDGYQWVSVAYARMAFTESYGIIV